MAIKEVQPTPEVPKKSPLELLQEAFPRASQEQLNLIRESPDCLMLNPAQLGISQFPTRESLAFTEVGKLNNIMVKLGYKFESQLFRTFMGEKKALEMWVYYKINLT